MLHPDSSLGYEPVETYYSKSGEISGFKQEDSDSPMLELTEL